MISFDFAKPLFKLLIKEVAGVTERENFLKTQNYIQDFSKRVYENFRLLQQTWNETPATKLKLVQFTITAGNDGALWNWPHGLDYTPKDAIITYHPENTTVSINYDEFDSDFIYVTASFTPCEIKMLVGTL